MKLIPAKCTQCGASIKVDIANNASVFPHCGMALITRDATINYTSNTVNKNYINAQNVNVVSADLDNLHRLAKKLL